MTTADNVMNDPVVAASMNPDLVALIIRLYGEAKASGVTVHDHFDSTILAVGPDGTIDANVGDFQGWVTSAGDLARTVGPHAGLAGGELISADDLLARIRGTAPSTMTIPSPMLTSAMSPAPVWSVPAVLASAAPAPPRPTLPRTPMPPLPAPPPPPAAPDPVARSMSCLEGMLMVFILLPMGASFGAMLVAPFSPTGGPLILLGFLAGAVGTFVMWARHARQDARLRPGARLRDDVGATVTLVVALASGYLLGTFVGASVTGGHNNTAIGVGAVAGSVLGFNGHHRRRQRVLRRRSLN